MVDGRVSRRAVLTGLVSLSSGCLGGVLKNRPDHRVVKGKNVGHMPDEIGEMSLATVYQSGDVFGDIHVAKITRTYDDYYSNRSTVYANLIASIPVTSRDAADHVVVLRDHRDREVKKVPDRASRINAKAIKVSEKNQRKHYFAGLVAVKDGRVVDRAVLKSVDPEPHLWGHLRYPVELEDESQYIKWGEWRNYRPNHLFKGSLQFRLKNDITEWPSRVELYHNGRRVRHSTFHPGAAAMNFRFRDRKLGRSLRVDFLDNQGTAIETTRVTTPADVNREA